MRGVVAVGEFASRLTQAQLAAVRAFWSPSRERSVYGVTSLGRERASASELLSLNRGHWEIENRLHNVRDFTCDEDRNRVRAKRLRRNLACLANAAISIVRLDGHFDYMPQAHRHFAARQGDALHQMMRRRFAG